MTHKNSLVTLSHQYKAARQPLRQMVRNSAALSTQLQHFPVHPTIALPNFNIEDIYDDLVKRFGQSFTDTFVRDLLDGNSMRHYDVPAMIDRYFERPWQPMLSELADIRTALRDESGRERE